MRLVRQVQFTPPGKYLVPRPRATSGLGLCALALVTLERPEPSSVVYRLTQLHCS